MRGYCNSLISQGKKVAKIPGLGASTNFMPSFARGFFRPPLALCVSLNKYCIQNLAAERVSQSNEMLGSVSTLPCEWLQEALLSFASVVLI